uniref:Integrase catalytic domain-containing protein n=1 Tax=Astyanax mexicanus TaxID=7994 RepID=A0A8B9HYG6_ASTMX
MTVVDRFSRGVRFIPFSKLPTALEAAEALFNHVFRIFGIPEDIVLDRGPQFISQVWSAFMNRLGICVSLSSGYHPQRNGQCERMNQELGKFLRIYCSNNLHDWAKYLPWAEVAQNSLISSTTKLTPFQCFLGYQPPLMPWSAEPNIPAVDDWMRRSEEVWEKTHRFIEAVLEQQKQQADRLHRVTPPLLSRDRVWLSTRGFRLSDGNKKLSVKYVGPFKIIKKINEVTFRLDLPSHYHVCPSFHVSLLKPVIPGPLDETSHGSLLSPPMDMEGGPVYAVERLLDSRRRRGALEYLVDWKGYGPEERSWVPAADVLDPLMAEDTGLIRLVLCLDPEVVLGEGLLVQGGVGAEVQALSGPSVPSTAPGGVVPDPGLLSILFPPPGHLF